MAWKKSTGLESSRQFFAFAPFARSHAVSQDAFSYFLIVIHKGNCSKLLKVLEVTFFIKTQTNKKGKKRQEILCCRCSLQQNTADTFIRHQNGLLALLVCEKLANSLDNSLDNFLLLYRLTLNKSRKQELMYKSCFHPSNTYLDNFIVRNHLFIYKYIFR